MGVFTSLGIRRPPADNTNSNGGSAGTTEFVQTGTPPMAQPVNATKAKLGRRGKSANTEPAGQGSSSKVSPKRPHKVTLRIQMVRNAYVAREQQLKRLRGDAVMPTHTRWVHELKPRMLAYRAVRFLYFTLAVLLIGSTTLPRRFVPFVPRPGLTERDKRAIEATQAVEYKETKFVSFFSFNGGVGKTTLAKISALMMRNVCNWLVVMVQDCNVDRGALGSRGQRTSNLSMQDAIGNLSYIERLSDLMRYCTRTVEGLLILASTRPDDLEGAVDVTREGLDELHHAEQRLASFVVEDLGTGSASKTNLSALDATHQLCIPTTGAKVDLEQAANTFRWLLHHTEEGREGTPYAHLARRSIIVINRWWPFWRIVTSPEKIRAQLAKQFGADFEEVLVLTVNNGAFLVATKFFTARLTPNMVSRRMRVQIKELNAAIATRVADGQVENKGTHLTHIEEIAQKLDKVPPKSAATEMVWQSKGEQSPTHAGF